jgi:CP family cyanate transporter-like MFS transporter
MEPTSGTKRGEILAGLGIILVALNLRTAVSGLSPIHDTIDLDIGLGLDARAALGSLPPLGFVLGGLITPRIARRIGLEWNLVVLLSFMALGHLIRGFAPNWQTIAVGSSLVLIGSGMGNISLPPVVKHYFPHRIGLMSSTYIAFVSIGSILPPLIAVPLSDMTSWRFALGSWVLFAVAASLPWLIEIRGGKHSVDKNQPESAKQKLAMHRSPTAWAVAVTLCVSSIIGYGCFAWLPDIAKDAAGMNEVQGGIMLAIFTASGLPTALGIPYLASRMKNVSVLIYIGVTLIISGALCFIFIPTTAPYLWAFIFGTGPLLFPLALVLINLRTESPSASLQLSAFAQFIGYSIAALVAPLMGLSRALTGNWNVALAGLAISTLSAVWAGIVLSRNHTVESELRVT